MTAPDRRPRESDTEYAKRCYRWSSWKRREPLVDLSYTPDTEVAEYRQWAGTRKHHHDLVATMIRSFST